MDIFNKVKFILRKPKLIIITGNGRFIAESVITNVLKKRFKVGRDVLIFNADLRNKKIVNEAMFLAEKSQLPILVITNIGDICPKKDSFFGTQDDENIKGIVKLAKFLSSEIFTSTDDHLSIRSRFILNFDDNIARSLKNKISGYSLTFGFRDGANLIVSDVKLGKGMNFKVNFKGNIIPYWLNNLFGKEYIYAAMAATICGTILGMNLIEISQSLRLYQGIPGKMKLIDGINGLSILDNSGPASFSSIEEALEILKEVQIDGKKVAVLGDVSGPKEHSIEYNKSIGKRIAAGTDLLFVLGERAKFLAEKAMNGGMEKNNIFQFNDIKSVFSTFKKVIKEGDLVLVGGSTEVNMRDFVSQISLQK